jgi:hypothetical protein
VAGSPPSGLCSQFTAGPQKRSVLFHLTPSSPPLWPAHPNPPLCKYAPSDSQLFYSYFSTWCALQATVRPFATPTPYLVQRGCMSGSDSCITRCSLPPYDHCSALSLCLSNASCFGTCCLCVFASTLRVCTVLVVLLSGGVGYPSLKRHCLVPSTSHTHCRDEHAT